MIRDFWRNYRQFAYITAASMQIVITIIIGLALIVGGMNPESLAFVITILATALITLFLNVYLVTFLLMPLRDAAMAITSAAGQEPTDQPATPNIRRYATNGFREILLYLYSRDDANEKTMTTAETTEGGTIISAVSSVDELTVLKTALSETKAGVVILDMHGTIQFANKAAPVTTDGSGVQHLELLFEKKGVFEDWLASCRESAVHAEQIWRRVPNRIVGDEERRIFNITANYEKGSAAEVVLVMYDETEYYKPEDDDLDFISFAAHELRGPITVIRGYLDVLSMELEDSIAPDQRELIKRLTVSANRLSGYINNILNTSKFDRRHLQVHLAEEHLSGIYAMIRDDMQLRAAAQHRLLTVELPDTLPTVAADRSSLSEVISNLIDNALKYSNEGGAISVSADVDGNFVRVSVVDNGIGIPTSVMSNLFHKFYRSHRSRETVAGTGIGLYICKAIIESHGGKIGVNSIEGQGSTFWFTVPIYASVADKLQSNDFTNEGLISSGDGWIRNHSKFTG